MTITPSAHLAVGSGSQIGILTLWTKKEHVMAQVPENLYAVCAQLYSRDEGISNLVRSLLEHKNVRDIVCLGADLNRCLPTLKALWENGVSDGQVIGAPGYVDSEISEDAIDRLRSHVTLHDISDDVDEYEDVASYIKTIPHKPSWGDPEIFPKAVINTPDLFPQPPSHVLYHRSLSDACVELARRIQRFGDVFRVQIVLGSYPFSSVTSRKYYKELSFGDVTKLSLVDDGVVVLDIDIVCSDELVDEFAKKRISRFTHGDPISNFLIRLGNNQINVTHLGADGRRLEVFSSSSAQELYQRICHDFRIASFSHAAYLGYELARAQQALDAGELFEQDQL